ncbi:response regulator transcription factor [Nocardia rhizosphaerihabitans]|uniref:response regulator transcription factor n=1 Tax=Nocardia rhizosphaerihabitans TaxID=1691570 RepID=UPI00367103A8
MPATPTPLPAGESSPTSTPPRVLVVDDEENIAYLVGTGLRMAGCTVEIASTGREALVLADSYRPDAIVLDIMLPDDDGYAVLTKLRGRGCDAPVLFLTARSDTTERVRGLTSGGDDYIVKPFVLEEVVARVQVALRRRGATTELPAQWRVADLVLDDEAHRVWRGDEEIHLTVTEFTLLRCLITNVGRVVTRARILDHVWQYNFDGESAVIETFISSLRKKIDRGGPKLIHTVRGVGYCVRDV